MQIHSISIPVKNIEKAIVFYTKNLHFIKKTDISKIDKKTSLTHRKVSLISTISNSNIEIIFSTLINSYNPLLIYQKELFKSGVPYLYLSVKDLDSEYMRLQKLGINFSIQPSLLGLKKIAVFNDGCGNHIQIIEHL